MTFKNLNLSQRLQFMINKKKKLGACFGFFFGYVGGDSDFLMYNKRF